MYIVCLSAYTRVYCTLCGGELIVAKVENSEIKLGTWSESRHKLQLVEAQMEVCHTVYELHGRERSVCSCWINNVWVFTANGDKLLT